MELALLRRGDRGTARQALHRSDQPDWRLVPDAPPPAEWLRALPDVGSLSPRVRRWYAGAATLAVVVVAGLWAFGDALLTGAAPLVPHRVVAPIGEGLVRDLGGRMCNAPAGVAALDRLTARLKPVGGFAEPVRVTVLDTAAVNALAAPGGRVVLFRGIIDEARAPDEVAGVLAHELAHVDHRHPTKALLRHAGVSLLLQGLGGDTGGLADLAMLLGGSRRAEADADAGAVAQLRASRISPAGLATFFERMRDADRAPRADATERALDRIGDFAATHPGATERAGLVAAAVARQGSVTPALSAADWQALRTICSSTAAR